MEYVFLLVSVFVVYVLIYNIGRNFYTRKELVRIYKEDNLFLILHIFIGCTMVFALFAMLCAFNNTLWHLPYLSI